jgi:SAM-dependent methyltransferase
MANGTAWREMQRRLRDGIMAERHAATRPAAELPPPDPDLRALPIVSNPGPLGQAATPLKGLLRRLMRPWLLDAQSEFNLHVAGVLEAHAAQLQALVEAQRRLPGAGHLDYAAFERAFVGDGGDVAARSARYSDYFGATSDILDIGCGKGEFVRLLLSGGVTASGIDIDPEVVAAASAAGLPVQCADATTHLASLDDAVLGGVMLRQVVEHMTSDELLVVLHHIARVLRPGGVLIVETINPESWPVVSRWFPLDPTHVRLVHPQTLEFLMESNGMSVKATEYLQPVAPEDKLPRLELEAVDEVALEAFNAAVDRVNDRLFGPLDYFVVAQR